MKFAKIKRSLVLVLLVVVVESAIGQMLEPVKWQFNSIQLNDCEYELQFKAMIDENWHLYGQKFYGDAGPLPTTFKFFNEGGYARVDSVMEGNPTKKFEPVWNMELQFFTREAVFKQRIKLQTNKQMDIQGEIEFMLCSDVQCLPPSVVAFRFAVAGGDACIEVTEAPPSDRVHAEVRSWWSIFIAGFLGGLAALFTPCVFPMVPMTVSFFTKGNKSRAKGISNAIIYAVSIIAIYVLLGLGVTRIFGPDALNALSTNVWFNLAFFVLLVVFAISFLGGFEIVLPSKFVNTIDAQGDKGGLIGIFFMAFTLALVSFSCTGPIIGTLLVETAVNGGIEGPFWGMFGFSAALAFPFGLFAIFPGWLKSLPKSGGWLNSVKVVLGFLELALALKFASNADLVVQAGILTREIFLALWIVIFGLLSIYLLGWIRLSHDNPVQHLSIGRLLFATLTLAFTVYLIPGLWGAPLKLIGGFPPPDFYAESPRGVAQLPVSQTGHSANDGKQKEHCPNGLPCFHDYDEGLAYARQVGKPLMLDFTGWACVNCRKMEALVWTDAEVDKRLREDLVVVSLYVDDKTELPENERQIKKLGQADFKINTIGNKWSYRQASVYKTNAQPQYVLIDHQEQMLTPQSMGYNSEVKEYLAWLDKGIHAFRMRVGK